MKLALYLKLLRPKQWLKNLMLLFPPFLGGVAQSIAFGTAVIPFAAFCAGSSATYILNDILDASFDSHHYTKKLRPIASGEVAKTTAGVIGIILLIVAFLLASVVSSRFLLYLVAYVVISASYSLRLKHIPIVDLFCISGGFLLRLEAGGVVFGLEISDWLFLSVFLLSIFLSTGKRLCEKNTLRDGAGNHRKSLLAYSEGFLEGTMYMTAAAVLVTYTMYVISRKSLVLTVPLCTFGLLRYLFVVQSGKNGDPTESLLKDGVLFVVGVLWVFMVGWGIYGR